MTSAPSDPHEPSSTTETSCPSDRVLDLMLAGAVDETRSSALREHLSACPACSARFAELGAFRDEVAPGLPTLSELVPEEPPVLAFVRRRSGRIGAVLGVAAAVAVWVGRGPSEGLPTEQTRAKGSAHLGFYVKRGEQVFPGGPGALLRPGDAIEFSYEAPSAGYLAILSLDGAGHASIYFPMGPRAQMLSPGTHLLEQSTILDAVLGRETLYAVWCEAAVEIEPMRRALESSRTVPLAPGCRSESLEVEKRLP